MSPLFKVIRTMLTGRMTALLLFVWALAFAGMFLLPVRTVPGNSILLQSQIYSAGEYWILGLLSFLSALVLVMQFAIFMRHGRHAGLGSAAAGGAGLLSAVASSLFASATCGLCLGAIAGFLGFGAITFLVENRPLVVVGGSLLLLVSLFLSARRLVFDCQTCRIRG